MALSSRVVAGDLMNSEQAYRVPDKPMLGHFTTMRRGLGLVSAGATYSSQDIVGVVNPGSPDREASDWYQYYFHTDRGRKGLDQRTGR